MSFLAFYMTGVLILAALFVFSMHFPRLGLFVLAMALIVMVAITQHEKREQPTKTTCLYCT